MGYTIEEHIHRGAVWDAGRAASVKGCRFRVQQAKEILEACGFDSSQCTPNSLPEPSVVDDRHRDWRGQVIAAAAERGLRFTHGVAAKLINCYLKARFLCAGYHDDERVKSLHPPVDAVLLDELAKRDIGGRKKEWRRFHDLRWSKFDSATYQSVIDCMRQSLGQGEPLWKIEEYWPGHQ